jgi:YebC/PmpR family DNA-binding regulatory protein
MSGHSHWAGIKHRKGINDAKRASTFTKFGRLITIAAREGGKNPEFNFKLKLAIDQARAVNMPKENIERAIKRGTGELKDGAGIQEVIYEAYGSGQIAMLIKATTDNKNRTLGEIKTILTKSGGKMVPSGSVSFLFKQVGAIHIETTEKNMYDAELKAIDAGVIDTNFTEGFLIVYCEPENLKALKEKLEKEILKIVSAGLSFVPLQKMSVNQESKIDYERLLEKLDEQEDIQEIFDNL